MDAPIWEMAFLWPSGPKAPGLAPQLIAALRMLEPKRDTLPPKKHGNIPL